MLWLARAVTKTTLRQYGGPPTTHHPHKRPSSSGGIFWGVVCELSEPKKKGKIRTTPSFALAMLIANFVGVVRGFRGPKISIFFLKVLARAGNNIGKYLEIRGPSHGQHLRNGGSTSTAVVHKPWGTVTQAPTPGETNPPLRLIFLFAPKLLLN